MSGPRLTGRRELDPSELGTTDQADLADALEAARRLEASMDNAPVAAGPQFSDRVMGALADEPTPAPVGFLTPLRRLGPIAGFGASVRQAWASIGATGRPPFARAAALAYVLVIAIAGTSLAGAATVGFAGLLGNLGPRPTQASPSTLPLQTTAPATELPSRSEPPDASEEPSGGPDASDDSGGSGGPEPSDDSGDSSGSGGTSSGGGSDDGSSGTSGGDGGSATSSPSSGGGSDEGGSSATSTPKPSQTPRPTGTPKPTQTSGSGWGSDFSN